MNASDFFTQYSALIILAASALFGLTVAAVVSFDAWQAGSGRRRSDKVRAKRAKAHRARIAAIRASY